MGSRDAKCGFCRGHYSVIADLWLHSECFPFSDRVRLGFSDRGHRGGNEHRAFVSCARGNEGKVQSSEREPRPLVATLLGIIADYKQVFHFEILRTHFVISC